MNISKFGFGLSLAAVVGLAACGDDSSSFSPAPHDDPDTTLSSSSETSEPGLLSKGTGSCRMPKSPVSRI